MTGLEYRDGRVTAVRHRSGQAAHVLPADLVVDAMGRASRLAAWLDRDGCDGPPLQRLATSINYASALFKRTRPLALTAAVALFSAPYLVDGVAVAGLGAIEHEQWLVLLMGYDDSRPGRTLEAFQDTCAKLPPVFAEAVRDAVTGEIFTYHQADSRRRDFAGLARFPEGLLSVGDAVASFTGLRAGHVRGRLHASCLSRACVRTRVGPPGDRDLRPGAARGRRRVDPLRGRRRRQPRCPHWRPGPGGHQPSALGLTS